MIEWLIDALAVYRLTRLVTKDSFPPILRAREWLLRRWPSEDTELGESEWSEHLSGWVEVPRPEGVRAWEWERRWVPVEPHWLGELITCVYCASIWLAGLVVAGRAWLPGFGYLSLILAFSALAGFISKADQE